MKFENLSIALAHEPTPPQVVVGGPGSGKTTLLAAIMVCLFVKGALEAGAVHLQKLIRWGSRAAHACVWVTIHPHASDEVVVQIKIHRDGTIARRLISNGVSAQYSQSQYTDFLHEQGLCRTPDTPWMRIQAVSKILQITGSPVSAWMSANDIPVPPPFCCDRLIFRSSPDILGSPTKLFTYVMSIFDQDSGMVWHCQVLQKLRQFIDSLQPSSHRTKLEAEYKKQKAGLKSQRKFRKSQLRYLFNESCSILGADGSMRLSFAKKTLQITAAFCPDNEDAYSSGLDNEETHPHAMIPISWKRMDSNLIWACLFAALTNCVGFSGFGANANLTSFEPSNLPTYILALTHAPCYDVTQLLTAQGIDDTWTRTMPGGEKRIRPLSSKTLSKVVKLTDELDTLPTLGGFWELKRMREVIHVNSVHPLAVALWSGYRSEGKEEQGTPAALPLTGVNAKKRNQPGPKVGARVGARTRARVLHQLRHPNTL
jgi:hypothetical protein